MKLADLLISVKEEHIPKTQLETLYTEFLNLFSVMQLRMGELEKEEALFMEQLKEETVAAGRRAWRATPKGQALIELKRQSNVVEKNLSAVRHRIFSVI